LRLAKEPTVIVKGDGTTLEVPVDLRTRSSVIRAGKDVIDLDARLNGLYEPQAPTLNSNVIYHSVIVLPKLTAEERADQGVIIDVEPEPSGLLSDGGTPGSEE
jgi:hypothetical protein